MAQIDLFGGAGEAIATSVPGLLEMIVRSPCGARLLASCHPPAGRAYAYVVARDNHRRNAINKPHGVLPDALRSPYGVRVVRRRSGGGKPSARSPPPNLNMFKFRGLPAEIDHVTSFSRANTGRPPAAGSGWKAVGRRHPGGLNG